MMAKPMKTLELHCPVIQFLIITVTSPIVINVPTRGLLTVETKDSFGLWLAKFKYQKTCLETVSTCIAIPNKINYRETINSMLERFTSDDIP